MHEFAGVGKRLVEPHTYCTLAQAGTPPMSNQHINDEHIEDLLLRFADLARELGP